VYYNIKKVHRRKNMKFKFCHNNINVLNLQKSLDFYEKALGLKEVRRKEPEDKSFIIVYLGDGVTSHKLELTWLRDWDRPYNLGDNEFHLALRVDDFDGAYKMHKEMGCICFENKDMGIYFISDPDNYWVEILPTEK
jgi:lactoylglutathione lyase